MGRGVEFEIGGKARLLRFDANTIADMEESVNLGINELLSNEQRVGLYTVRLLLWGALRHEDRGFTKQRAGLMIQEYLDGGGKIADLSEKLMEAIVASGLGNSEAEAAVE